MPQTGYIKGFPQFSGDALSLPQDQGPVKGLIVRGESLLEEVLNRPPSPLQNVHGKSQVTPPRRDDTPSI